MTLTIMGLSILIVAMLNKNTKLAHVRIWLQIILYRSVQSSFFFLIRQYIGIMKINFGTHFKIRDSFQSQHVSKVPETIPKSQSGILSTYFQEHVYIWQVSEPGNILHSFFLFLRLTFSALDTLLLI